MFCRLFSGIAKTKSGKSSWDMMDYRDFTSRNEVLFGHLVQSRLIMERNFEGKKFDICSQGKPTIDCMFFPSTQGDEVKLDPMSSNRDMESSGSNQKYLSKSTIIMCNPNALVYQ